MHKIRYILFILFFTCLISCEEKPFSINTQNKQDITIIYGFLDPQETTHYIKIYKGFLTEGNAFEAAKDLHNYSYIDSIEVYMEEYSGSQWLRNIPFDTTTCIPKDSGTFAYPLQVLYKCDATLNNSYHYILYVKNRYNSKIVRCETDLVGNIYLIRPIIVLSKEISINENQQIIRFRADTNIHYFEVRLNYYYTETLKDGSSRSGEPVSWKVGTTHKSNNTTNNSQELTLSFQGYQFFQTIGNSIADDPNVTSRHTDSIVIQIHKAGEDMYKYILASAASTGLNQERLTYTNIESYASSDDLNAGKNDNLALGLFSSLSDNRFTFRDFGKVSRDSLFYGRFTKHLKFTDIY